MFSFCNVMASCGLYYVIYINNLQSKLIIFVFKGAMEYHLPHALMPGRSVYIIVDDKYNNMK